MVGEPAEAVEGGHKVGSVRLAGRVSINLKPINLIPRAQSRRRIDAWNGIRGGVERGPRGARITRQASGATGASSTSVV
jgi:hypothetical protein